jgi:hypothetical protein
MVVLFMSGALRVAGWNLRLRTKNGSQELPMQAGQGAHGYERTTTASE